MMLVRYKGAHAVFFVSMHLFQLLPLLADFFVRTGNKKQVFLPTDDAFEAEGITTTSVTNLPQPVVQNLLRYHLLEGAVSSEVIDEAADFYTLLQVKKRRVCVLCCFFLPAGTYVFTLHAHSFVRVCILLFLFVFISRPSKAVSLSRQRGSISLELYGNAPLHSLYMHFYILYRPG